MKQASSKPKRHSIPPPPRRRRRGLLDGFYSLGEGFASLGEGFASDDRHPYLSATYRPYILDVAALDADAPMAADGAALRGDGERGSADLRKIISRHDIEDTGGDGANNDGHGDGAAVRSQG